MLKFGVFLEWGIILKSFMLVRVQGSFWVVIFFLRPTVIKVAYKGDLNCIAFEKYKIVRCQNLISISPFPKSKRQEKILKFGVLF